MQVIVANKAGSEATAFFTRWLPASPSWCRAPCSRTKARADGQAGSRQPAHLRPPPPPRALPPQRRGRRRSSESAPSATGWRLCGGRQHRGRQHRGRQHRGRQHPPPAARRPEASGAGPRARPALQCRRSHSGLCSNSRRRPLTLASCHLCHHSLRCRAALSSSSTRLCCPRSRVTGPGWRRAQAVLLQACQR